MRLRRVAGFGYIFAFGAVVVTALLVAAARGCDVSIAPFLVFLLPIMLAALIGGLGPGLLATGLGCVALIKFSAGIGVAAGAAEWLPFALFCAIGALASWLIGLRPRTMLALGRADRLLVEQALRESEARYRAIVDTQSEMICRFAPDGEILFVNGGYARARGTTPEELLGGNFWRFIAEEDQPGVRAMLARLTPANPEVRIENRFETAEGVRWTLWTNRALAFDDAGQWTEAQSTGIDITDRKEAEEALLESSRRKNEFLAILGHELRNPLAPLRAGLELVRRGGAPGAIEDVWAMMTRQLDHLTRLVEDLLDLSRISRGDISLRKKSIDLRKVIDDAVELTRPLIVERRHRLVIDSAPEALAVDGDFQRLVQVVSNLLSNAAKYTEPGGTIEIFAEEENGSAVIRVRDTGYGFPPDRLDMLFEMFTQVEEHRARTGGGGLGIGLALSRQLVEQHGGTIEARSAGLEHGSEFVVRLPVCQGEARVLVGEEPSPQPRAACAVTRKPRKILVVDDNVDAAESLGLVLEFEGHNVRVEHDAQSALDAVRSFSPEVVLLDIGLPGMDGYELARHIRRMPNGRETLLVAITGWGQSSDRDRAFEAGFDEHLPKPVDWQALAALIESDIRASAGRLTGSV